MRNLLTGYYWLLPLSIFLHCVAQCALDVRIHFFLHQIDDTNRQHENGKCIENITCFDGKEEKWLQTRTWFCLNFPFFFSLVNILCIGFVLFAAFVHLLRCHHTIIRLTHFVKQKFTSLMYGVHFHTDSIVKLKILWYHFNRINRIVFYADLFVHAFSVPFLSPNRPEYFFSSLLCSLIAFKNAFNNSIDFNPMA